MSGISPLNSTTTSFIDQETFISDSLAQRDHRQEMLDIGLRLVPDTTNTYYFEAEHSDLMMYGVKKGAILVVDRSVNVSHGCMVIAYHNDEWVLRQLLIYADKQELRSGPLLQHISLVNEHTDIFGVVLWSCNPLSLKYLTPLQP